ncbi:predicted protein [Nematostella vectensis]|uniref:C2 domain-containing protein n=1 Tax=Nematostella vectensis TaxID=45351 RepID=A7TD10_NEMVE|nr:predicted protein [Nematostella vectensis]|eukprot:XP_001618147.1 hypothetical protein NEMVEDRAFT_v1g225466 [Nematostella vectensis]
MHPTMRKTQSERASPNGYFTANLQGTFRVYPLPSDPSMPLPPRHLRNLPPSEPVDCIIRVYVIRALDLQPQDSNGLADPYLVVSLGKTRIKDRDNYIANNLNPVFGK